MSYSASSVFSNADLFSADDVFEYSLSTASSTSAAEAPQAEDPVYLSAVFRLVRDPDYSALCARVGGFAPHGPQVAGALPLVASNLSELEPGSGSGEGSVLSLSASAAVGGGSAALRDMVAPLLEDSPRYQQIARGLAPLDVGSQREEFFVITSVAQAPAAVSSLESDLESDSDLELSSPGLKRRRGFDFAQAPAAVAAPQDAASFESRPVVLKRPRLVGSEPAPAAAPFATGLDLLADQAVAFLPQRYNVLFLDACAAHSQGGAGFSGQLGFY